MFPRIRSVDAIFRSVFDPKSDCSGYGLLLKPYEEAVRHMQSCADE